MSNNGPHSKLDNKQFLEKFSETVLYAQVSNDEGEVLTEAVVRFEQLLTEADESLVSGLEEIISYPGNLSDSDVRVLKRLLAHITKTVEI